MRAMRELRVTLVIVLRILMISSSMVGLDLFIDSCRGLSIRFSMVDQCKWFFGLYLLYC